ncbi:HAUS1 protein, partial [Rostratula benghalensis]|nr:HAUS1 protein [Rostratula benghalensis]
QVTVWLKKVFGSEPIPQYEVNKETVDFLYDLAECSEARERDAVLLIEDMKQRTAEYEEQTEYLKALLGQSLGISPWSLSSEGTRYLDVLVSSAMTLETKDTSLVSFFCAINNMTSELYATEAKNRKMELELKTMREKTSAALVLEQQLKEDLKKTEEYLETENCKVNAQLQKIKFLNAKSEDFLVRIKAAEEQLAARGFDQSLTHGSLVKLSE